jgi:hypothetical protein
LLPLSPPGSPSAVINDLISRVQAALQNRSDVNEMQPNAEMRPSRWIRDTLREITANNPFEELRQPNPPLVTIGPGLGLTLAAGSGSVSGGYGGYGAASSFAYLVSAFLVPADDVTLMEDPVIFLDPGTNNVPRPMDYLTPKAFVPLLVGSGIPYFYTRFGNQFWFATPPNQNYQVYLPYQVRHPFNDDNLLQSQVRVPQDWFDIVAYASAERGAIAFRWNEQRDYLHKILYGDPKGEGRLGLIQERKLQQERDRRLSVIQVTPAVSRY